MSECVDPLSLAYLVEVSIALNLAYRELSYRKTKSRISEEVARIAAEFERTEAKRNLDGDDTDVLVPEVKFIKQLWQARENWDSWVLWLFYRFLESGWNRRLIISNIVIGVVFLFVITFFADQQLQPLSFYFANIQTNCRTLHPGYINLLWVSAYVILVVNIATPLLFYYMTRRCSIFVLGNENDPNAIGKLYKIEKDILDKTAILLKVSMQNAANYKVDREVPPNS